MKIPKKVRETILSALINAETRSFAMHYDDTYHPEVRDSHLHRLTDINRARKWVEENTEESEDKQ